MIRAKACVRWVFTEREYPIFLEHPCFSTFTYLSFLFMSHDKGCQTPPTPSLLYTLAQPWIAGRFLDECVSQQPTNHHPIITYLTSVSLSWSLYSLYKIQKLLFFFPHLSLVYQVQCSKCNSQFQYTPLPPLTHPHVARHTFSAQEWLSTSE